MACGRTRISVRRAIYRRCGTLRNRSWCCDPRAVRRIPDGILSACAAQLVIQAERPFLYLGVDGFKIQIGLGECRIWKDEIQDVLLDAGIERALTEAVCIAPGARIGTSLLLQPFVDPD